MSRRPFYKRYPGDFAMGTRDLSLEERGAYNDCLDLMYDKGRPIPDEARWIAGFLGITPRKWGILRESLLAAGKLIKRGDYLTNARFERELELDETTTEKAVEWGRMGGKKRAEAERQAREAAAAAAEAESQPGLFGELSPAKTLRKRCENAAKTRTASDFAEEKPQKSAENDQGPLKPARASRSQSPEERGKPLSPRGGKSRLKSARAAALPKAWEPEPFSGATADLLADWPEDALRRELDRFRDHAAANGRTAKDWNAAWRNWMRKAEEDRNERNRKNGGRGGWSFGLGG